MSKVELRQIIGEMRGANGKIQSVAHDMDILLLDERQIATISHVPGAGIHLLGSTALTPSQEEAVMAAVAAERGGVRPSQILAALRIPGEFVEDDSEETDVDNE